MKALSACMVRTVQVGVVALALPCAILADTLTWQGGVDANWGTAGNWTSSGSHTVPQNGDTLVVSGTTVNNLGSAESPLQIAAITAGAGAAISGNPVAITGGAGLTTQGAFTCDAKLVLNVNTLFECKGDVTFNGEVSGPGKTLTVHSNNHSMQYRGKVALAVYSSDTSKWDSLPQGFHMFYNEGNEIGTMRDWRTVVCLNAENALGTGAVLELGYTFFNNSADVYLYGKDQTIDRFTFRDDPTSHNWVMKTDVRDDAQKSSGGLIKHVSGEANERITMRATGNTWFTGRFMNDFRLCWWPVAPSYVMVVSNRTQLITSPITVSNGIFAVEGPSNVGTPVTFPNLTGFNVSDGATVRIGTGGPSAFPQLATLNMDGSARFEVTAGAVNPFTPGKIEASIGANSRFVLGAGTVLSLKSLTIGGVVRNNGVYTGGASTDDAAHADWIEGDGVVVVETAPGFEPTEFVWNGGAAANRAFSAALNWEGGAAPTLDDYSARPVFATGGSEAVVDTRVRLNGLKIDSEHLPTAFTISSPDATPLVLGGGGISATGSAFVDKTLAIGAPLMLLSGQTWSPYANLLVTGALDSVDASTALTIASGNVTVTNDNGAFTGPITLSSGRLALTGACPLGESDNTITVQGANNSVFEFAGGTIKRPISITGAANMNVTAARSGTTTTVEKAFAINNGGGVRRMSIGSGTVVFKGGITGGGLFDPNSNADGWYVIRDVPLQGIYWYVDGCANLALECTGNYVNSSEFLLPQNVGSFARLETRVENAFTATCTLKLKGRADKNNNHVYWNLCGKNQQCGQLTGVVTSTTEIYSDEPATLTFNETTANTNNFAFKGAVSLVKNGAAEFQMVGESTSTGGVHVVEGKLTFGPGAKWAKGAKRAGVFAIDDGAKLELAEGVAIKVAELRLNGQKATARGTWGSTASSAANKNDAYFAGRGILSVQGGLCVIFR